MATSDLFTISDKPLTATGVKNRMIAKLLEQGASGEPIASHWQGVNRVAQSLLGGYQLKEADKEEKANQSAQNEAMIALLTGMPGGAPSAAPGSPPAGMPSATPPMAPQATPRPPVSMPPPQNVSGPVPPNDPTMSISPRQVAAANAPPPPLAWGDGQVGEPGALPPPRAPAPSGPAPVAPQQPPMTSSAAPPEMQAKVTAMLQHPNPAVRKMGQQLATQLLAQRMKGPSFDKLNDEMLYDKTTGRTMPAGPGFRPLTDPAERARYGIPAEDKRPYQVGPGNKLINPPAENRVSIDQRAEGAFSTNAAKLNAERYNKIVEGGFEAQTMVADLNALRDIGSRITTGKTAQVTQALGPYAEALGVKIDKLDDLQAYQAIVSRMAPRMRVAGSGATSDFEMRQFLAALPQLGTTPQGNEMITNTLQALQEHKMAAADIGSRALAGEITPREAEKLIRELPNPLELWKKSRGQAPSASPGQGGGEPTAQDVVNEMRRRGLVK